MKINDCSSHRPDRMTHLAEIPIGQVFRGRILQEGKFYRGVFYKADRRVGLYLETGGTAYIACVVVSLSADPAWVDKSPVGNLFETNCLVRDYEPLDVELVIKGVQR